MGIKLQIIFKACFITVCATVCSNGPAIIENSFNESSFGILRWLIESSFAYIRFLMVFFENKREEVKEKKIENN